MIIEKFIFYLNWILRNIFDILIVIAALWVLYKLWDLGFFKGVFKFIKSFRKNQSEPKQERSTPVIKQPRWTEKQKLIFTTYVAGFIFAVSLLLLFESYNIVKASAWWILIITLPLIFWINKVSFQSLAREWRS